MATGDLVLFEEFAAQLGAENHAFATDVIKVGLISNAATEPTAADTTPTWSDYSANEVDSVAGNYTADGETLANQTYTETDGVGTFDADDVLIAQNASGFTDAYWAIIYNSTNATGMAIGFVELGGPVSEVAGPVAINWAGAGIFTVTIA